MVLDVGECAEPVVLDLEQPVGRVERLRQSHKRHRA
jgi:hypothetical protein